MKIKNENKLLFSIFIIFILIISCDNNNVNNHVIQPEDTSKIKTMPLKWTSGIGRYAYENLTGNLSLYAIKILDWPNREYQIQIIAGLKGRHGGSMILGGVPIKRDGNYYTWGLKKYDSNDSTIPKYGNEGEWSLSGNDSINFDGFKTMFYIPKLIELESNNLGYYQYLSVSDDVNIKWVPDRANNKGMWIWVHYNYGDTDYSNDYFFYDSTADDGFYQLKLNKLDIPSKGIIEISLFRYNELFLKIGNEYIALRVEIEYQCFNQLQE
ncbi:MAG: hypothetical protein V1779_12550 [bacterium]